MSRIRTAVLPVAGLGTRFLPATKCVPKEMLPLLDRPCIDYIITEAVEAGIENVVLVTSRGKDALVDFFDRKPALEAHLERAGKQDLLDKVLDTARRAEVVAVRQQVALGLGHAVLTARPAVGNEPFAVLLGDDIIFSDRPTIGDMIDRYDAQAAAAVVALMEVPQEQTNRYGICAGTWRDDGQMQVSHMVEKPDPADAPSRHAIVGRYVLPPDIFDILQITRPGRGNEIQLTDALADLASQGRVSGYVFDGERHDTGNVLGLLRASMFAALRRPDLRDGFRSILEELSGL